MILSVEEPVPVSVIGKSPLRIEERMKRVENIYTKLVEEHHVSVPIWFEPKAEGKTLMCGALQTAHDMISRFVSGIPACFPPIVINITRREGLRRRSPAPSCRRFGTWPRRMATRCC